MKTRIATFFDSLLLSSLCTDVQRLHAEHHPEIFKMPQDEDFAKSFFDEMLADPAVSIIIAEDDGSAVGYILCKLVERPENPFTFAARTLLIDQVSVRPTSHGMGTGTALIQEAEGLARKLAVQRIQLDSWAFNLGAHAFFERQGFQKYNHRFWRKL